MDLNHEFTVDIPVEDAWKILTDVERIAPCLPVRNCRRSRETPTAAASR